MQIVVQERCKLIFHTNKNFFSKEFNYCGSISLCVYVRECACVRCVLCVCMHVCQCVRMHACSEFIHASVCISLPHQQFLFQRV